MALTYKELQRSFRKTGLEVRIEYWDTVTPKDTHQCTVIGFPPRVTKISDNSIAAKINTRLAAIQRKIDTPVVTPELDIDDFKEEMVQKGKMVKGETLQEYLDKQEERIVDRG